jgi:hypothetical protein
MDRDTALDILDLEDDPSNEDINEKYRELARNVHPDQGGSSGLFKKIQEARDTLIHTDKNSNSWNQHSSNEKEKDQTRGDYSSSRKSWDKYDSSSDERRSSSSASGDEGRQTGYESSNNGSRTDDSTNTSSSGGYGNSSHSNNTNSQANDNQLNNVSDVGGSIIASLIFSTIISPVPVFIFDLYFADFYLAIFSIFLTLTISVDDGKPGWKPTAKNSLYSILALVIVNGCLVLLSSSQTAYVWGVLFVILPAFIIVLMSIYLTYKTTGSKHPIHPIKYSARVLGLNENRMIGLVLISALFLVFVGILVHIIT